MTNHFRMKTLALCAVVFIAGCGRDRSTPADSALQNDLSLAAQQRTQDSLALSLENGTGAGVLRSSSGSATTTRRTGTTSTSGSTRRTSGSSGSATSSSGSTVTSTSGGDVIIEKNTKRDAAIGAAAGAIIGASTSKDKVKGGVIGAVVGGVLGGVIGNNVDVKKKKGGG
jgi:hypothetical protein